MTPPVTYITSQVYMKTPYSEMKVVIMKRLPRFDKQRQDPTKIKSRLSVFGNNVYDHLYFKHGCPKNIKVASLGIGTESEYVRNIVMGNPDSQSFDGIHLRGTEASRHFTYRAAQVIISVSRNNYVSGESETVGQFHRQPSGHQNCPQAKYQRQSQKNHGQGKKSTQSSGQSRYSVPTQNSFGVLGN